jgi:hypothetical protein
MNVLRLFDLLALDPIDDTARALVGPWLFGLADVAPRIEPDLTEQEGRSDLGPASPSPVES